MLFHHAPAFAAGAPVSACALLSEAEASKLAGAPLVEVAKSDTAPTDENGNDTQSSCGHFPKGYRIANAGGPPESGVLVKLHTLRSADAAKRFYEGVLDMHKQMPPSVAGALTMVKGIGAGAYLLPSALADPTARITTLTFLKGSVVASVQVWKTAMPVDAIARAAASQVAARLP